MDKPASLRAWLTAALPDLAREPERLQLHIERGSLAAVADCGRSFEYRYVVKLVLQDFAGHPDALFFPLLAWIQRNEPALLSNPQGLEFEVYPLDSDKSDVHLEIHLTEAVVATPHPGGGYDLAHLAEPQFETCCCDDGDVAVYLRGELVARWTGTAGA